MSKELRAFRKICRSMSSIYEFTDEYKKNKKLIEIALKNYEELTSKQVLLYGRTHEEAQKLIDIIYKNYKEVKITNLIDENKVKAFDIIKEKNVNVRAFKKVLLMTQNDDVKLNSYNSQNHRYEDDLTKDEFDLLKEVLL